LSYMVVRPPPPTLFPYTTLFRSTMQTWTHGVAMERGGAGGDIAPPCAGRRRFGRAAFAFAVLAASPALDTGEESAMGDLIRQERDRKSTRLNSSHVKISYAVFCL